MRNSKNENTLNNFYISFEKVIVPLEYLARANYKFNPNYSILFGGKKYYDIYGKMKERNLINDINKSYNELDKCFKSIINNSNYKPDILFTEREIKGYLENIILWKQTGFKNKDKIRRNFFTNTQKR